MPKEKLNKNKNTPKISKASADVSKGVRPTIKPKPIKKK